MKTITGFIISAVIAFALIAGAFVAISTTCSGDVVAPAPSRQSPRLPIHYETSPGAEKAIHALYVREAVEGRLWLAQAAPARQSWWRNFVCDIRVTDLALAGFALFLVLASIFQGLWMLGALQATERSARVVDNALISAQRAYVFLREFRVNLTKNPLNEEIQTCTVQPIWENTGSTPTRNGRAHINWKYFERSIPNDFDFGDFDELGNRVLSLDAYRPLIVGPKSTALASIISFEPSMLRQVRDLQGKLLIWGWAEYDEVFTDAARHRTEFCYQLVVSGSPASHVGFSQYRLYNGVDRDCMRQPAAPIQPA